MSDTLPPDPKNTAAYRAAKLAVIILSVLIIIALIALVVGAVMTARSRGRAPDAPAMVMLAPGARIIGLDSETGRLILRVRSGGGDEVDIIDTRTGRLVGQVKTAPSAK